jgi:hypothetical protein
MEGNSLSLEQTDLVINEGQTISGKSMREHLAINHQEAIVFIKIVQKNVILSEKKSFPAYYHFTRILPKEAGNYRTVQ